MRIRARPNLDADVEDQAADEDVSDPLGLEQRGETRVVGLVRVRARARARVWVRARARARARGWVWVGVGVCVRVGVRLTLQLSKKAEYESMLGLVPLWMRGSSGRTSSRSWQCEPGQG